MIKNRKQLGKILKTFRENQKISTYKLEKKKSIPFKIIKSIEEGDSNYTVNSLLKYASAIGCKINIEAITTKHNENE